MLTYTNVLTTTFTNGEQITGGTSGATAYVVNVQSEPKVMYIVQKSGTFLDSETVTGGSSGATATLAAGGSLETNQSGRILVTTFSHHPMQVTLYNLHQLMVMHSKFNQSVQSQQIVLHIMY